MIFSTLLSFDDRRNENRIRISCCETIGGGNSGWWEIGGRLINWRRAVTVIYRVAEEERARMRKGGRAT